MSGVLLDFVYFVALVLSSPFWLYRMLRHGRYRRGMGERFGAAPIRYGLQPVIWVYGVSLGEIKTAQALVAQLHSQLPDYRIVVSSWTDTGMDEARRLFGAEHQVFARPLDFSWVVRRALNRLRPDLVVLIEGDVWPNFLAACNRRNIPAVVVNGRISQDKGYPRYKKIGPLAAILFNRLTALGVQDEAYADRFRSLGVRAEKVQVTGMMKFDRQVGDRVEGQETLAEAVGIAKGEELVVAGGTGDGEEKIILDVFAELRKKHPQARLAIVPRKPERFDEVAKLIEATGFVMVRRSERPDLVEQAFQPVSTQPGKAVPPAVPPIILGDTMGELRKFYALARGVFVGRSLVKAGGSDMIESAALGKPTAFGPHTFNFPQAEDLERHGCVRVADAAALVRALDEWLTDPAGADRQGAEAQEFIRRRQGATRRNVEMICRVLGRVPAATPGNIATERISST